MPQHHPPYSAEFKARVALAALSEAKTVTELAREYKVDPAEIRVWRRELVENASALFARAGKRESDHEAEVAELHRKIGKLRNENDILSKLSRMNLDGLRSVK